VEIKTDDNGAANATREFAITRIYVKDQSFETPASPGVFDLPWEPTLEVHIQSRHTQLSDDRFEVVLKLTVTAHTQQTLAFLAEVQQAGIFIIRNFVGEELQVLLGQVAPSTLYPFARAAITGMVTDGSFPGLYLAPINFEALYEQSLKQAAISPSENSETIN
jgi:preprotein translocase subunit SecB